MKSQKNKTTQLCASEDLFFSFKYHLHFFNQKIALKKMQTE